MSDGDMLKTPRDWAADEDPDTLKSDGNLIDTWNREGVL